MWGFDPGAIRKTFITISMFSICGWITACRPKYWLVRSIPAAVLREFPAQFYFTIGIAAFGLAFIRFAIPAEFDFGVMYNALLEDRWSAPWATDAIGGWDSFLPHLAYFGYILPVLTVLLSRRVGWLTPRTIILGLGSIIVTLLLAQSGGRRILGVMLGSAMVYWFLSAKRPRIMAILALSAAFIGLGLAMNFMLEVRGTGLGTVLAEEAADQRPLQSEEDDKGTVFLHVDDNFLRLTQMNYIFPDLVPYTTWQYLTYTFLLPVPRAFWPGKPLSPGFSLSAAVGAEGVGLTSSAMGELVMCGGPIAVCLGGLFFGFVAASVAPLRSEKYGSSGMLLFSCGLLMLFEGVRAIGELILMSYMLLAYIGLSLLYQRITGCDRANE
jgi:hypothetical protein